MTKEVIKIDEIENSITKLTKFEITKEELEKIVEKTKNITIKNLEDKAQLEIVKRARIDLRDIEITIEKTGKSYRDTFTKINKCIMSKEKELLAITNPEFNRLKTLEEEAKQIAIKVERIKLLPYRKEELTKVDNTTDDSVLLEMDDKTFNEYLLEKSQEKLEKERLEKENKEREEKRLKELEEAKKQAREEAERKAEVDKQEAIDKIKREQEEKEKREKQAREEKEEKEQIEKEKIEKEKDYQKFLSDNDYNETEFKIVKENEEIKLYKFVATYKINK